MTRRTSSIRSSFAFLGGSAVLVVVVLVAFSAVDGVRRERAAAEASVLTLSAIVAEDVAIYMQQATTGLDLLVARGRATLLGDDSCEWWSDALPFVPMLDNAVVLRLDGVSECPRSPMGPGDVASAYTGVPYFRQAIESDTIIVSSILPGGRREAWTVALARSIRATDGTVLGVAVVSVRSDGLGKSLRSDLLPPASLVTITDRDGMIVARSADARTWVGTQFSSDSFDSQLVAGLTSVASIEGQDMLFGSRLVPSVEWRVFVGLPTTDILAPVRSLVIRSGFLALGGSLLILTLVGLGFRKIAIPLGLLAQRTRSALLGETDAIELRGPRELVEIALSFDDALRQQRAVESRLAMLSCVAEQCADPVIVTDTGGLIEYVNSAFERLTGYLMEEVHGKSPRILRSGVHSSEFYEKLWTTIASGEPFRATVTNRKKGGDLYVAEQTISPLHDDNGEIVHYVSTARDVTERVAIEARVRRAEKLEAIGRLAGGVAHDFNNLLAVIRGHAELLDLTGPEDVAHANRASVETIIDASEMAANLTRELLAFSREEVRSPQAMLLDDSVRKVCKVLDRLLPADVHVDVSLYLDGVAVQLNPVHAEQILLNLALNARDAMSVGGGTITIRTNFVTPPSAIARQHSSLSPRCVHLEVSDTGEGMVPETTARIFDPYFTTKGMGSGLGLATVYGVVEGAGGAIEVQSRQRRGTAFHVYLPVSDSPLSCTDEPRDKPATTLGGSETILVADDTDEVLQLVVRVLSGHGYDVISASDGSEALSLAASLGRPIDLLVTDVMMPVMKGPELYERLKVLHPRLPVVFMSGYNGGANAARTEHGEQTVSLQKPFGSAELLAEVRRMIDETRVASV